jgi:uncharacterized protein
VEPPLGLTHKGGSVPAHAFQPAWWCRGPHRQTLWPYFIRRKPKLRLKRERLELPDGDFIDLDWTPNPDGPIVVILHGLEGSSKSGYARGLLRAFQDRCWRGVVMHFRGCSGEPNRLARSYHSGETGDLATLIQTLRVREPHTPLAVVGFSLGGNVLLKWLGENGRRVPLQAAIAVSVPFLLDRAADRLDTGFSRIYQWGLLRRMRRSLVEKRRRIAVPLAVKQTSSLRTFREFDEHITAPLHGFSGADHYYTVASSRQYLKGVTIPTLVIQARDDPFMTPDAIPEPSELSGTIEFELHEHGGHVGFVSGCVPWHARYWLEERIPAYLERYMISGAR